VLPLKMLSRVTKTFLGKIRPGVASPFWRLTLNHPTRQLSLSLRRVSPKSPMIPSPSFDLPDFQPKRHARQSAQGLPAGACSKAKDAYILASLARLYAAPGSLNDPKKALECAKDAHAAAPGDASISQFLGHFACESGDYKWASSLLQEAAHKLPDQPALLYDLARSYYGLGQLPAAETALQNALKGAVAFDEAGEAKRLLSMIQAYRDPAQRPAVVPQLRQSSRQIPITFPP